LYYIAVPERSELRRAVDSGRAAAECVGVLPLWVED